MTGKLRCDPVFNAAAAAVGHSRLPIVDLGCGLGLLGMWLRSHAIEMPYRGYDLTSWKVAAGNAAAARLGFKDIRLEEGDMCSVSLPGDCLVCAFDVIHYLQTSTQLALLRDLSDVAKRGSIVLIRTGVKACGWRTQATVLEEWWTRATGWIRGGHANFPRLKELVRFFESDGCRVSFRPLWGNTPFSSHWFEISGRD